MQSLKRKHHIAEVNWRQSTF